MGGVNTGGVITGNTVSGFSSTWIFDDAEGAAVTSCNRDSNGDLLAGQTCVEYGAAMISPDRLTRTQSSFLSASSAIGPTVTASGTANTKGSYSQLVSATSFDVELILIEWHNSYSASADSSSLLDIGIDTAGGSSYTVIVPDILSGSIASPTTETGKRSLLVPVSIPQGSSVGARIQSVITSHSFTVGCRLFGGTHPNRPRPHRGPVTAYGVTTASSTGVSVTNAGSANTKSAWVNVGTTSRRHAGFVIASQLNTGTVGNEHAYFDIGVDNAGGSSYTTVLEGVSMASAANEAMIAVDPLSALTHVAIPSGATIGIRAQSAGGGGQDIFDVAVYGF